MTGPRFRLPGLAACPVPETGPPPPRSVCSKDDRFAWTFVRPVETGTHSDAGRVRCLFRPSFQSRSGGTVVHRPSVLSLPHSRIYSSPHSCCCRGLQPVPFLKRDRPLHVPRSVCSKDDRFAWTFVRPVETGTHSDAGRVRCLFRPSFQSRSGGTVVHRPSVLSLPHSRIYSSPHSCCCRGLRRLRLASFRLSIIDLLWDTGEKI